MDESAAVEPDALSLAALNAEAGRSAKGAHYVLLILYLVCVFSYVDRQLIGLLGSAIQKDLHLNDKQFGLAAGPAFTFLYVFIGIPLSQLADRTHRVRMLAACLTVWSVLTAFCGAAGSFIQLVISRMGVAVGEAGGYPASLSMISDIYPAQQRSTATAIFLSGTTAGALISLIVGGMVNQAVGWRWTFVIAAVPGLLLTAVLLLTVREPQRGRMDQVTAPAAPRFFEVYRILFSKPLYRWVAIAGAIYNLELFSLVTWMPTYAIRTFHLGTAQVGLGVGLALGIGASLVMIFGGAIADRLTRRSPVAPVYIAALGQLLFIPLFLGALAVHSFPLFCGLYALAYGVCALGGPMNIAATQSDVPPRVRGSAAALLVMISTLSGYGLGPPLIGAISDAVAHGDRAHGLHTALMIGVAFNAIAALILLITALRASRRGWLIGR